MFIYPLPANNIIYLLVTVFPYISIEIFCFTSSIWSCPNFLQCIESPTVCVYVNRYKLIALTTLNENILNVAIMDMDTKRTTTTAKTKRILNNMEISFNNPI